MFLLNKLQQIITKKKQRKGRGEGSNRGKNSGKGHKGQTKRGHVRIGFEGGQKPLNRRLPKFKGFKALPRKDLQTITLAELNKYYTDTKVVSMESLLTLGVITDKIHKVRIIKTGTLENKLTFKEEDGLYLTKGVKDII
jgi:large subunit ribosomal protein L15